MKQPSKALMTSYDTYAEKYLMGLLGDKVLKYQLISKATNLHPSKKNSSK